MVLKNFDELGENGKYHEISQENEVLLKDFTLFLYRI